MTEEKAEVTGFMEYPTKPILKNELAMTIRRLLDQGEVLNNGSMYDSSELNSITTIF